jgi:hypothetical protein
VVFGGAVWIRRFIETVDLGPEEPKSAMTGWFRVGVVNRLKRLDSFRKLRGSDCRHSAARAELMAAAAWDRVDLTGSIVPFKKSQWCSRQVPESCSQVD